MKLKLMFIFYIGSIIGSFIGVVIYRRPKGLNFITGRSRCEQCGAVIPIYCNIPILSYIMQRGRCRNCKSKISKSVIIYEIVGGTVSLYSFLKFGLTFNFIIYSVILYIVMAISFTDINEYFIYQSDIVILFIFILIFKYTNHNISISNFINGLILFSVFFTIMKISKAMGQGDVLLSFAVGFNFNNIADLFDSFKMIFITASAVSVILIIFKVKTRKDYIAFSPYMLLPLII